MARTPVPVRGAYPAAAAQLLGHSREAALPVGLFELPRGQK